MPESDLRLLTALHRFRRVETDAARRDLGDALVHATALSEQDAAIGRELGEARQFSGEFDRDTFAAWFERMRTTRAQLTDAVKGAEARAAAARTALARRRVAETTAEEALTRCVTARENEVARRDQLMLEDVARARRRAT